MCIVLYHKSIVNEKHTHENKNPPSVGTFSKKNRAKSEKEIPERKWSLFNKIPATLCKTPILAHHSIRHLVDTINQSNKDQLNLKRCFSKSSSHNHHNRHWHWLTSLSYCLYEILFLATPGASAYKLKMLTSAFNTTLVSNLYLLWTRCRLHTSFSSFGYLLIVEQVDAVAQLDSHKAPWCGTTRSRSTV